MWVRDYAPYFVVGDRATAVDYTYSEPNRDLEENFSVAFAATFRLPFDHCHLTLEGGNLTSNGEGLCITTTKVATSSALAATTSRGSAIPPRSFSFHSLAPYEAAARRADRSRRHVPHDLRIRTKSIVGCIAPRTIR